MSQMLGLLLTQVVFSDAGENHGLVGYGKVPEISGVLLGSDNAYLSHRL